MFVGGHERIFRADRSDLFISRSLDRNFIKKNKQKQTCYDLFNNKHLKWLKENYFRSHNSFCSELKRAANLAAPIFPLPEFPRREPTARVSDPNNLVFFSVHLPFPLLHFWRPLHGFLRQRSARVVSNLFNASVCDTTIPADEHDGFERSSHADESRGSRTLETMSKIRFGFPLGPIGFVLECTALDDDDDGIVWPILSGLDRHGSRKYFLLPRRSFQFFFSRFCVVAIVPRDVAENETLSDEKHVTEFRKDKAAYGDLDEFGILARSFFCFYFFDRVAMSDLRLRMSIIQSLGFKFQSLGFKFQSLELLRLRQVLEYIHRIDKQKHHAREIKNQSKNSFSFFVRRAKTKSGLRILGIETHPPWQTDFEASGRRQVAEVVAFNTNGKHMEQWVNRH